MRSTSCLLVLLTACGGSASTSSEEGTGASSSDVESSGGDTSVEGSSEGGDEAVPSEDNPDAQSNTVHDATFTHCAPPPPADCADCGLTINLRRSMAWRPTNYEFEILTEGNHIRCAVTLPCTSPAPVACDASPGAPRVTVETAGCGGPTDQQRIVALHFEPNACPEDVRVEAFRGGVGAGNESITPRFANGRAQATMTYRR